METGESSSPNSNITQEEIAVEAVTSPAAGEAQPEVQSDRQTHAESRNSKVRSRRPHPAAYALALEKVDGDYTRLKIGTDGSVTVLNNSRFDNQ